MNAGLILAAGRGERFGGDQPKQFQVLNDVPVLQFSIRSFEDAECIETYGVLVAEGWEDTVNEILDRVGAEHCAFVIQGGDSRRDSVRLGLEELAPHDPSTVMIHDSARPGVRGDLLNRLYEAWEASIGEVRGVVPTVPLRNTIKRIDLETGRVEETLNRDRLRAVQTPQLFDFTRLLEVHKGWDPHEPATDDASMLEARGDTVQTVRGHDQNLKITRPGDIKIVSERIGETKRG